MSSSAGRSFGSFLALAVVVLLVPVTVAGTWLHATVSDSDAFVRQADDLLADPDVRSSLATVVSQQFVAGGGRKSTSTALDELLSDPRIPASVRERIGDSSSGVAAKLQETVAAIAARSMETPAFRAAWSGANRALHRQLLAQLSAPAPLGAEAPMISLDLKDASKVIRDELTTSGFPAAQALPTIRGSVPVVAAEKLEPARRAYGVLDTWSPRAPWILAVALVLGLALAPRRLTAVAWTALVSGLALIATVPLVALASSLAVSSIAADDVGLLVEAMATAFTEPLVGRLWLVGLVLMAVGMGAGLAGLVTNRRALR